MIIGFLQFCPLRNNVQDNITQIRTLLRQNSFDIIVLPELSNSGYLYEQPEDIKSYSESGDGSGPFLSALIDICVQKDCLIVSGFSEITQNNLYNSAAAVTKDGIISLYRKTHLFDREKTLFSPGDTGFITFEYKSTNIGMMICFDWIFPESARSLALGGAQIIAHPANLVMHYCQKAMITRSLENSVFTITANRYGKETLGESTLSFTGRSQIVGHRGEILASSPKRDKALKLIDIDPKAALNKLISPNNDLFADRRPDQYLLK